MYLIVLVYDVFIKHFNNVTQLLSLDYNKLLCLHNINFYMVY